MPLAFFVWCEATFVGETVRNSVWLFPAIESAHLLALCLLGGATLMLDLRLVGLLLTSEPVANLARLTGRWVVAGLIGMVATGIPLFLSEATKCYSNQSFWVKMAALPIAVAVAWSVRRWIANRRVEATSPQTRVLGALSMMLWFTVAAAGRWIGFSS